MILTQLWLEKVNGFFTFDEQQIGERLQIRHEIEKRAALTALFSMGFQLHCLLLHGRQRQEDARQQRCGLGRLFERGWYEH